MRPLGFHLIFRLDDDRVIAPSRAARRRAARVFARLRRRFRIVAWRVVDTHVHVLALATRRAMMELYRQLQIALTTALRPGVPFFLVRLKPLTGQTHLENAFDYVLRQAEHHGVGSDGHHDGSCVLDLLGLRVVGAVDTELVLEHAPRVTRAQLLRHLGVETLDEHAALDLVAESAAAAFALPDLAGKGDAARARAAAVHAVPDLGTAAVAGVLGMDPRSVRRLRSRPEEPDAVRAVRLQMALRAARPTEPAFVREGEAVAYVA